MFCENCGSDIPSGSRFCLGCGMPAPAAGKTPMDPKKKVIIGVTVASIVVILAVIFLPMLGGNKNPTDPIDHYFNAIENANYSEYEKCFPDGLLDSDRAGGSPEYEQRQMQELRQERISDYGSPEIQYRLVNYYPASKAEKEFLFDTLNYYLYDNFQTDEITEVYCYEYAVTYGTYYMEYDQSFIVYKYRGHWYLQY